MTMRRLLVLVAAAAAAAVPAAVHAQSRCKPLHEASSEYALTIKEMMVSSDSADIYRRMRWQLPAVDSSEVTVVTSGAVCDSLHAAYTADLFADGGGPEAVYAVRVGTHFLVWTFHRFPASEFIPLLILNSALDVTHKVVF